MNITAKTTLKQLQEYERLLATQRGFDDETLEQKFIVLVEEVGELAKAIRGVTDVKFADDTRRKEIEEELADVQLLLLNVANRLQVDMITAVENKETKNRTRVWK